MSVKYFGSDALNKLIDLVKTALGLKADNVSGATADDIATLTSGGNLKDSGISSLKVVDTGFVASAEIKNNVSANALGLDVKIEPNQDLHGYDYPWVGGTGKNKLAILIDNVKSDNTSGTWSGNTYTENNVTFACDVDANGYVNQITVNGTPTSDDVFFRLSSNIGLSNGDYILNGCPTNGSTSTYFLYVQRYTGTDTYFDTGTGVSFTYSGYTTRCYIGIRQNVTANNIVYKPMIRLASVTDGTFERYSNICPISGRVSLSLNFVGDTTVSEYILLGSSYYGGTYNVLTGGLVVDRLIATFDGSNDENWTLTGQNRRVSCGDLSGIIKNADVSKVANIISNQFKATTANNTWSGIEGIAVSDNGAISVHMGAEGGTMSVSDWRTWLSNNPLKVVYELAEPITIDRGTRSINLPSGNSTGTASTGDIRVKYEKKFTDYYDDEIEELRNLISAVS